MKVMHVSFYGSGGGAGIAMRRLHEALCEKGIESVCLCVRAPHEYQNVFMAFGRWRFLYNRIVITFLNRLLKLLRRDFYAGPISFNFFSSNLHRKINASDADIVHFHWVNAEMISVREVAKINKPIVWTLHDMWPFCGIQHYPEQEWYCDGYPERLSEGSVFDKALLRVDRWIWAWKRRAWRDKKFHVVAPSNWLAECARKSILFQNQSVTVIPNAINVEQFCPVDLMEARIKLGLPSDKKLVLCGAADLSDHRKGMDLLIDALSLLDSDVELVAFGKKGSFPSKFNVHDMGVIESEDTMQLLYGAADVFVLPSRMDNLPNTGVESVSCGTPVVAFRVCGIPDIVKHMENGYLATPFDPEDLASGIEWVLAKGGTKMPTSEKDEESGHDIQQPSGFGQLSVIARNIASACFSNDVVAEKYISEYDRVLSYW